MGINVILSTPQHKKTSPELIAIAPVASCIACIEEPHHLLTVIPATCSGISVMKETILAILLPCAPSGYAQPVIMSSMSFLLI